MYRPCVVPAGSVLALVVVVPGKVRGMTQPFLVNFERRLPQTAHNREQQVDPDYHQQEGCRVGAGVADNRDLGVGF